MAPKIVTEVAAETAARILYLSTDAVNGLCAKGVLRARRPHDGAAWQIDYDSIIDFKHANSPDSKAGRR